MLSKTEQADEYVIDASDWPRPTPEQIAQQVAHIKQRVVLNAAGAAFTEHLTHCDKLSHLGCHVTATQP